MVRFKTQHFKAGAIGYIDDNNLVQAFPANTPKEIIQVSAQKTFSAWEGLLHATDGKLSTSKCIHYSWQWKWHDGIPSIENIPCPVQEDDGKIGADHKPAEEPTKYLGIRWAPDGSLAEEYMYRKEEAEAFAASMKQSTLTQTEAWIAYTAIWEAKTRYYAPICTFTQKEWETLQSIVLHEFLPKIKVNRNSPRCIVNSPINRGGIGITPAYTQHGYEMVKYMLTAFRNKSPQARLLGISASYLYLEAGQQAQVLKGKCPEYLSSNTWLEKLWTFLSKN